MSDKYKSYSDEELINIIQIDPVAEEEILIRYKDMVLKKARSMFLIGGEQEDLIQEGMIGLLRAVRSYQNDRGSGFRHYADICVSSKMYSAIESSKRLKHIPLNTYISLNDEESLGPDGKLLIEVIAGRDEQNPETLVIDRENVESLDRLLEEELSNMESQVLNLLLAGIGYSEIAVILELNPKQVDNAIQRIKNKLKTYASFN